MRSDFSKKNRSKRYIACSHVSAGYKKDTELRRRTRKKLVATASRCEDVYNRAGKPSVTFCGKEEQRRECALIFQRKIGASDT